MIRLAVSVAFARELTIPATGCRAVAGHDDSMWWTPSQPDGITVLAVIGRGNVAAVDLQRQLGTAEFGIEALGDTDAMAERLEALDRRRRKIPFDIDGAEIVADAPARRVTGSLRILTEVGNPRGDLEVA